MNYIPGDSDLLSDFKNNKLPKGVYVFDDKKSESFEDDLCNVVVHGQGFEEQHIHKALVKDFPKKKTIFLYWCTTIPIVKVLVQMIQKEKLTHLRVNHFFHL